MRETCCFLGDRARRRDLCRRLKQGEGELIYKLVVIGGGPGGYVAAIRAAQLGAKVALVEREKVGGTCLNRGCIPTKIMAEAASILHTIRAGDFGVAVEGVSFSLPALMHKKAQVVSRLAQGIEFLLKKNRVDYIRGTAKIAAPGRVSVSGGADGPVSLECENIVLATGSDPVLPKNLGYDGDLVITSDEALNLEAIPERFLIIGAGVIGCEFASIFTAMGSRVTVVDIMPGILPQMDKDISLTMRSLFRRRGIEIKTGLRVLEIKKDGRAAVALLENGETVKADKVLVSVGRKVDTGGLGLEKIGAAVGEQGEVLVNGRMATTAAGVYAVGDVTGKMQLAHVASAQGKVAAEAIMGLGKEMDYSTVPSCVYTNPEVGSVGMTEQEARARGLDFKTGKFPFLALGKAQATGNTEGFVKIMAESGSGRILGAHVMGPRATDLIAEAVVAMRMGATAKQLADIIHAHPTLAEAFGEAAETICGMSIHI